MSEPLSPPPLYQVSYSERVRQELLRLARQARAHGLGAEFLAAVREIDRRLHLYPQFGQPLRDLELEPAQLWIGVVLPLVVRYDLDERRRLVLVVSPPFLMLPRTGA
jgi:hypothetical protein